jgi:hypothetical protein
MSTINPDLVPAINQSLEINLPENAGLEELREKLSAHINNLVNHDFEKLVFLLYRIDVDEARMRALLSHKEGEDSPGLIADLIIERQLQKIQSRQHFRQGDKNNDSEEKW